MLVTIFTELGSITGYAINCACPDVPDVTFGDRNDAVAYMIALRNTKANLPGCADEFCAAYGPAISTREAHPSPEMNMSNTNAASVFDTLGVHADPEDGCLSGSMTGEDLLGRVLIAQAVAPADEDVPDVSAGEEGAGSGRWVDCERSGGYLENRLAQVREIADFSVATGRAVCWS